MNDDDDEVLAFVRTSIISVTALELLLLLRDGRPRKIGELVRELRSSEVAVVRGLASLQNSKNICGARAWRRLPFSLHLLFWRGLIQRDRVTGAPGSTAGDG